MVHEFVHVSLLVEVCKTFGEAVDEHTRVRCFDAYERIGPVLAINWNEGFSDRSFRTGCEVAIFFVGDCVQSCAVDSDSAEESTMCEQLAPEQERERSSDGDVNSVFDVGEDGDKNPGEEDDDF